MLFSLLKHYLDTDTALKVSQSVYCFTTSISYGVENYFPRLWGTGISDAIFTYRYLFGNYKALVFDTKYKITRNCYLPGQYTDVSTSIYVYARVHYAKPNFSEHKSIFPHMTQLFGRYTSKLVQPK